MYNKEERMKEKGLESDQKALQTPNTGRPIQTIADAARTYKKRWEIWSAYIIQKN